VGKILPDWILTLALVVLLAHTTYTTLDKARSQYIKETKTMLEQSADSARSIMQQAIEEAQEEVERESLLMREDDFDDYGDDDDGYDHNSGATWKAATAATTVSSTNKKSKFKKSNAIEMTTFGADSGTGPSEAFLTGSSLDSLSDPITSTNSKSNNNSSSDANLEMDLFEKEIHLSSGVDDELARVEELRALLRQETKTPVDRVLVMSAMVVVVVGINLVKGGGSHFPSILGIQCGSFWYWGLTSAIIMVILVVSLWARGELISKWLLKTRLRYKYLEGDIEWNYRNTVMYPCICVFAGLFAGMFGIGGGVV